MPTAGSIITNVKVQVGDTSGDFLTDAIGMEWLTQAEQHMCDKILPLDEIKDYALTSKQIRYDLPTNYIFANTAMWYKNANRKLEFLDPSIWDSLIESTTANGQGMPDYYSIIRQQLVIGPNSPSANSATTTASGAMTTSNTTLSCVGASGIFRSRGWVKVDSEVIEYTGVATTTLTGCTRSVHGTTAATHASAATITEIDLQLRYRKMSSEITATTQFPEVPYVWHKGLEKYVMYLYFLARGDSQKAEIILNEFNEMATDAQEKAGRRALALRRIRDKRHSFRWW